MSKKGIRDKEIAQKGRNFWIPALKPPIKMYARVIYNKKGNIFYGDIW